MLGDGLRRQRRQPQPRHVLSVGEHGAAEGYPMPCPVPPCWRGTWADPKGKRATVDACDQHVEDLANAVHCVTAGARISNPHPSGGKAPRRPRHRCPIGTRAAPAFRRRR
jgi:hypothetical protein